VFDGLAARWIAPSNEDRVLPLIAQPLGLGRLGVALVVVRTPLARRGDRRGEVAELARRRAVPLAARHGLQDSYQPPACSRRPTALTGSTQRGARGASGSTKAQTPSSFDARFRSRKRLRPAMVDVRDL
jgi:hypothetical protein